MLEPIPDHVPSTAAVNGHPIHPALVVFPIASLVGALVTDVASQSSDSRFWPKASRLLLETGIASGALAGVFGFIDFVSSDYIRRRSYAWTHMLGNLGALSLSLINLSTRPTNPRRGVPQENVLLSMIVALMLGVTGWLGGELSYRYRVGVMSREERQRPYQPFSES